MLRATAKTSKTSGRWCPDRTWRAVCLHLHLQRTLSGYEVRGEVGERMQAQSSSKRDNHPRGRLLTFSLAYSMAKAVASRTAETSMP